MAERDRNRDLPPDAGAGARPTAVDPDDATGDAQRRRRDARCAVLLAGSAGGDTQAFEQFYDHCLPQARALARRFVRDADLDDVLADSFFQAWREAPRFDPARGSAMSWLLTIVRSRALDSLRQRRTRPGAAGDDEPPETPCPDPGPEDVLAQAQAGSQLHAALAELSSAERWVLGLAYYREMSHAEIASATALPLGTVKSLINRSQRKLRGRLTPRPATAPGAST